MLWSAEATDYSASQGEQNNWLTRQIKVEDLQEIIRIIVNAVCARCKQIQAQRPDKTRSSMPARKFMMIRLVYYSKKSQQIT